MAQSCPCGSDRPDTSSTSSRLAPRPMLLCNIEARPESISLANRQLLANWQVFANWHVACCLKCAKRKHWAVWPGERSGVRGKPYGESDTDHQQQELFV